MKSDIYKMEKSGKSMYLFKPIKMGIKVNSWNESLKMGRARLKTSPECPSLPSLKERGVSNKYNKNTASSERDYHNI